jgi:hypothetical protein
VGGVDIRIVRRQDTLIGGSTSGRVRVAMTVGAVRHPRVPVVLTKPGTEVKGSEAAPIFGAAVAARTTVRIETGAAQRTAEQYGELGAGAVAGVAIVIQHELMDVVEGVSPGRIAVERKIGRGQETVVTSPTVGEVSVLGILLVGLSCSHPNHASAEKRNEK